MLCGVMFFRCLGFTGLCQGMLLLCYLEGEIGLANMAQRDLEHGPGLLGRSKIDLLLKTWRAPYIN